MIYAAVMVILSCQQAACGQTPLAVVTYADIHQCRSELPDRLRLYQNAAKPVLFHWRSTSHENYSADEIYGDCVPVSPKLLAGRLGPQSVESIAAFRPMKLDQSHRSPGRAMALE
ncbi:hypothetical protein NAC44_19825 [Allorhizobium sp. BGMRC 0089]|uniref:hypothetical protein n=1 Tax=Allorhizobium sonneratiae TaxID=2934936 RepID=UPI0020339914|nr:hypothetical protein [Allorhizobium sonneratiae]MCM2294582.1 hypothetical protein [Allorhizobium sonneratiae]